MKKNECFQDWRGGPLGTLGVGFNDLLGKWTASACGYVHYSGSTWGELKGKLQNAGYHAV